MDLFIEIDQKNYVVKTNMPLDISLPMSSGYSNPNAFGISHPLFEPFKAGSFIGSVALGGAVNCENLFINAHGNGTHTECVGHISKERVTIHECLKQFIFVCELITVPLHHAENGDSWITLAAIQSKCSGAFPESLIIRSAPNAEDKKVRNYSGKNPPYLEAALCAWLREKGVKHLLIDLPSVDREEDAGALEAHRAFWNYPDAPRMDATITEMVFVPDVITDGRYLLNLQIASLQTDASPSKPVLYQLLPK